MIPAIIEHEGDDFFHSLQLDGQRFICDLYNYTWDQYAQERPFEISDLRVFDAGSDDHEILYVDVPVLDEMESLCYCAIAFAYDYSEDFSHKNIRLYHIKKYVIDNEEVICEVYGPDERVGCTLPFKNIILYELQEATVDLIWRMSFDESDDAYDLTEVTDPERVFAFRETESDE